MSPQSNLGEAESFNLDELEHTDLSSHNCLLILPREKVNIEGEWRFIYDNQSPTIRKLLEEEDIEVEFATSEEESKIAVEQSIDLGIPEILILYGLWLENKDVIKIALRKIADYYIQRGQRKMNVEYPVLLPDGSLEKVKYEGHPDDMPEKINSELDSLDSEDE